MNDATDLNWLHIGQKLRYVGSDDDLPPRTIVPGGVYRVLEIVMHPDWAPHWYGIVLDVAPDWVISLRDPLEDRYADTPSRPFTEYPLQWEPVDE